MIYIDEERKRILKENFEISMNVIKDSLGINDNEVDKFIKWFDKQIPNVLKWYEEFGFLDSEIDMLLEHMDSDFGKKIAEVQPLVMNKINKRLMLDLPKIIDDID